MKKLISALLIYSLILISTVKVHAYVGSSSGQWGEDVGVNYDYNSNGTLIIKGTTGNELVDSRCDYSMMNELKNIIVDNVGCVGSGSNYVFFKEKAFTLGYCYVNAETIDSFIRAYNGSSTMYNLTLDTLIFGDNVESIDDWAIDAHLVSGDAPTKIVIPATVTSLADTCMNFYSGEFTIVCEYGSEAYNWALNKQNYHKNSNVTINIEISNYTAYSNVVLDASQKYEIVVPETIEFRWSKQGWHSDTYIGVIGVIPDGSYIEIKTDDSFQLLGETVKTLENINVSTDNENTVNRNQMIVTTVTHDILESSTDNFEINNETKIGYKVEYECIAENNTLIKQTYRGIMKFIIAEE